MTEEYQAKTLRPSRGPKVRFKGRIIAETQWDTKDGCWMRFTVWETKGGAYIAQTDGDTPGKPDQVHCSVTVVEPMWKPTIEVEGANGEKIGVWQHGSDGFTRDETAMQIAVLQHFDFHDRAKALLKRELGWSPVIEVA